MPEKRLLRCDGATIIAEILFEDKTSSHSDGKVSSWSRAWLYVILPEALKSFNHIAVEKRPLSTTSKSHVDICRELIR